MSQAQLTDQVVAGYPCKEVSRCWSPGPCTPYLATSTQHKEMNPKNNWSGEGILPPYLIPRGAKGVRQLWSLQSKWPWRPHKEPHCSFSFFSVSVSAEVITPLAPRIPARAKRFGIQRKPISGPPGEDPKTASKSRRNKPPTRKPQKTPAHYICTMGGDELTEGIRGTPKGNAPRNLNKKSNAAPVAGRAISATLQLRAAPESKLTDKPATCRIQSPPRSKHSNPTTSIPWIMNTTKARP